MKREQTVTYKPGENTQKPMIRITNRFLLDYGFTIGSKIEVKYANGRITITQKEPCFNHNKSIKN